MSARSGVNPARRGSSTAEPATGRRKDWREEQLARRCMQRMEAGRDERKRQVAARRGSAAAGGGELVPMDAQALCKGIICAEMDDSWEGLSEDAYAELMYAAALLSLAGSHSARRGRPSRSRTVAVAAARAVAIALAIAVAVAVAVARAAARVVAPALAVAVAVARGVALSPWSRSP